MKGIASPDWAARLCQAGSRSIIRITVRMPVLVGIDCVGGESLQSCGTGLLMEPSLFGRTILREA
jgi:hypothetical protein